LLQFGQMAAAYLETVWKVTSPRVALLNIGEEESKGNQLALAAHELMRESDLNFVGNLEGGDIPKDLADVIVTDGFTGNVVVKTMEGTAEFVQAQIRRAITSKPWYVPAAALLMPAFNRLRRSMDYREYGAGPLLGVSGLVFIGHGRSDAAAIASALRVAREAVTSGMLAALKETAPARVRRG
ncbi:MAG: phosphate--acyl-ACP acyltransferase, partial [Dehalococcoidia bacterium]